MEPAEISKVVQDLVERIVRRLEDRTHGDLPTAADERTFGEQRIRLDQAIAEGAVRLWPQALSLDQCGDLAPMIERTLLWPDTRENDVREACRDAVERGLAAVCVNVEWIEPAAAMVKGSTVHVCVSVGFPAGGQTTEAKCAEIRRAVGAGADEVDAVIALARLREADFRAVTEDLQAAVRAAQGRIVKSVIEAAALTLEQKAAAAILSKAAGAHFVKSSTGFGPDAVTVGDVALLRAALAGQPLPSPTFKPEWPARVGAVVCLETAPGRR